MSLLHVHRTMADRHSTIVHRTSHIAARVSFAPGIKMRVAVRENRIQTNKQICMYMLTCIFTTMDPYIFPHTCISACMYYTQICIYTYVYLDLYVRMYVGSRVVCFHGSFSKARCHGLGFLVLDCQSTIAVDPITSPARLVSAAEAGGMHHRTWT